MTQDSGTDVNQVSFSFTHLSPDIILDAIESTGIQVASGLLALNSYENRVYQFVAEDQKRYVVKFYRPQRWSEQQLQEEHQFAFELHQQEIPIVPPLCFNQQSLLQYQGYYFCIYPSVGGRQFEVDNDDQLEWVGRFIGRIHQVGRAQSFSYRPSVNCDEFVDDAVALIRQSGLVTDGIAKAFFTILDQVANLTRQRYQPVTQLRLHGDCHPGNILWRDGPCFVDLDDCRSGPAVQDIWMMLSGDRNAQRIQLDILLEAYQEFSDFNPAELALIEPLRAMRMIHYMSWLVKRWSDPAFPQAFPWFATDKYWEQQVLALKEQYSALQEPPIQLGY